MLKVEILCINVQYGGICIIHQLGRHANQVLQDFLNCQLQNCGYILLGIKEYSYGQAKYHVMQVFLLLQHTDVFQIECRLKKVRGSFLDNTINDFLMVIFFKYLQFLFSISVTSTIYFQKLSYKDLFGYSFKSAKPLIILMNNGTTIGAKFIKSVNGCSVHYSLQCSLYCFSMKKNKYGILFSFGN